MRVVTRSLRLGDGRDEGHEAGTAEELGDEDGGVALGFGGVDPLQTRAQDARLAATLSEDSAPIATHLSLFRFFSFFFLWFALPTRRRSSRGHIERQKKKKRF